MPSFETPQPISIRLELGVGRIRVVAGDRTDTVVDVRPSDPDSKADVAAAEQTRVELSGGRLVIRAPRGWRQYTPFGGRESIDVDVDVPSGSDLDGDVGMATLACLGRLGECRFKTGAGHIQLDEAGPVHLKTGAGDITVEHGGGLAEVTTGTGAVRMTRIDGPAVVKNSNGDTWIGEVGRRPADQRRQRQDRRRTGEGDGLGQDRPRRHPPRRGRARCGRGPERDGERGRRDPRRGSRLARPEHPVRCGGQRPRCRRRTGARPRTRSTCGSARPWATSPSAARPAVRGTTNDEDRSPRPGRRSRRPASARHSAPTWSSTAST